MFDSLNRGIEIMKYVAIHRCVSVSEIAKVFEIDKSTASRILAVLAKHDLICKEEETMKYYSSIGTLLFSARTMYNDTILDEVRPLLRSAAEKLNMTVQLGVLKQNRVFLIEQVKGKGSHYQKEPAFPGMVEPFHCTALGKCILAFMSQTERDAMMDGYMLQKYTEDTITDISALYAELERIRAAGYARDMGEFSPKVFCLAIPIQDAEGNATFGLGVSGSREFFADEQQFSYVLKMLQKVAEKLNRKYSAKGII